MCGLAGIVAFNGSEVKHATIERMSSVLHHRGPDDSGTYVSKSVAFGFRRLAILDLSSSGHQPMEAEGGKFVIVFNGEIYNYVELRKELVSLGHQFHSSGDTEVLLRAYIQWGPDCLPRLNGMWSFLIHDKIKNVVFGSRDRFGIKPLFRYRSKEYVLFASEIKGIRASGLYEGSVNWSTAAKFLLEDRLDDTNDSFYSNIDQIEPGTGFELSRDGTYQEWKFWSLPSVLTDEHDFENVFHDIFEDAVKIRLRSDVPTAVFLSGGLDSTAILCSVARHSASLATEKGHGTTAFSFISDTFDETRYIQDTIEQTKAKLVQLGSKPEVFWESLSNVLWYHDSPVHSMTALVGYTLARLTAEHKIKVVLNGQGADEILAGYPSYFSNYWISLIQSGHLFRVWKEISEYAEYAGGSPAQYYAATVKRLFQSQLQRLSPYRHLAGWRKLRTIRSHSWFTQDLIQHAKKEEGAFQAQDLNTTLKHSVEISPLPLYLRVEDRNSMAHSLEVRLPFLDYRLVSLIFQISGTEKMRGPLNKFILREAMRGYIPDSVCSRIDKMGFPTESNKWMAGSLYEAVHDILSSPDFRTRGIYNVDAILKDLELHRMGKVDVSHSLFHVVQFERWLSVCTHQSVGSPGE